MTGRIRLALFSSLIAGFIGGVSYSRSAKTEKLEEVSVSYTGVPASLLQRTDARVIVTVQNNSKEQVKIEEAKSSCSCLKEVEQLEGKCIAPREAITADLLVKAGMGREGVSSVLAMTVKTQKGRILNVRKSLEVKVLPIVQIESESLDFGSVSRDSNKQRTIRFRSRSIPLTIMPETSEHPGFVIRKVRRESDCLTEVDIGIDASELDESISSWYGNLRFKSSLTGEHVFTVSARVAFEASAILRPRKLVFTSFPQHRDIFIETSSQNSSGEGIVPFSIAASDEAVVVESIESVSDRTFRVRVKLVSVPSNHTRIQCTMREQVAQMYIPVSLWKEYSSEDFLN